MLIPPGVEAACEENLEQAARDLVSRLTLEEKITLMSGRTTLPGMLLGLIRDRFRYNYRPYRGGGCRRLGIPEIRFADGPRGCVCGRSTCFPAAIARGAGWDTALEERVGAAVADELRVRGANYYGGVCINLLRHPGWGRAQETFGEDPHLLGEMGAALVRGVQGHGVMACLKHFAANSIENSRFVVDVALDERTLREVYLPHFRRCVREGAASVMGAYNRLRGEYCCQNRTLLRGILKGEWGFDGFVLSDFIWGVRETVAAARAGLDLEMPFTWHYGGRLRCAVKEGKVGEAEIGDAALRIVRKTLAFAPPPGPRAKGMGAAMRREHEALARESAEKGMVLLKNDGPVLPFDRARVRRLLVLGMLAKARNLGDRGSSSVRPPRVSTILAGLHAYLGRDAEVVHYGGRNPDRARALAARADAVVVAAGCRWHDEGEGITNLGVMGKKGKKPRFGGDRTSLALRPEEEALIQAAAAANPNCIVALIGGGAITMEEWRAAAPAILMAWYPGMAGGRALARLLFGEVNPSGKLPLTIPKREADLPPFDPWAERVEYGYYHGYTLFDKTGREPAFPFGFGLSYTSFAYENLRAEADGDGIRAEVEVANTGGRAGEEVVQLYVGFSHSKVDRPVKLLKGFRRVRLEAGEKKTVSFAVPWEDLAWYNPARRAWEVEAMAYEVLAGGSSRREDLLSAEVLHPGA